LVAEPLACLLLLATGGGTAAQLSIRETTGTSPILAPPKQSLVPTINVATAKPWTAVTAPAAVNGTSVTAFARDLDRPRWLHVLPNGDVLVAETNAPERPEHGKGLRGWLFER
jgi:glucose/arabinose dehydrogenase